MDRVDVLIVTSLQEELDAVLAQGRGVWTQVQDQSGAPYYVRTLVGERGRLIKCAAAWFGEMGLTAATTRSRQLTDELDPACIALCGVCAGRRGSVFLGDVIVADRVLVSDLSVQRQGSEDEDVGHDLRTYALDQAWRMNAALLAAAPGWMDDLLPRRPPSYQTQMQWFLHALYAHELEKGRPPVERDDRKVRCPDWAGTIRRLQQQGLVEFQANAVLELTEQGRNRVQQERVLYPDELPEDPPFRVHLGTLATTTQVIKAPGAFDHLLRLDRRIIGLDLAAGVIGSVATHMNRRWLVVKGVIDHADHDKDDQFRTFACQASARYLIEFLSRHFEVEARPVPAGEEPAGPLVLERLQIKGFKNIIELELNGLSARSSLGGRWTCLAGINGSGKTAILQSIALALLGDKLAEQLGSVRLARMVRKVDGAPEHAELTVTVRSGVEAQELSIPLSQDGIDSSRLSASPHLKEMRALWELRARREVLVAYGASRNLSEYLDNRYESLHLEVQRQMTLFDPQARVARAGLLLSEDPSIAPVLGTLRRLLGTLLTGLPLKLVATEETLRFESDGAVLPVSALPDGFRSTIAWLADLCAAWHEKARPEDIGDGDPGRIRGIVLIDEIDLHLHPSLQRVLVPRLREAMPHVQWIVTTHSPLVLASFDRHELKMLDNSEPGGVRHLDREILGFTTDQIYDWLMGTPPRGVVLEEMMHEHEGGAMGAEKREELAVLLAQAPDFNEQEARKRVAWRKGLLERLRREAPEQDNPEALPTREQD